MSSLRVGFDLFAGSSQAGTDASVPGLLQVETAKALPYYVKIKRLSDNYYWNNTTPGWQAGAVAEADEFLIPGSSETNPPALRRLLARLPQVAFTGITSAGVTFTVYASGDTPSSDGVDLTLEFKPTTV